MLGKGWFPSQLGGLERYYRELLEQLPEGQASWSGLRTIQPTGAFSVMFSPGTAQPYGRASSCRPLSQIAGQRPNEGALASPYSPKATSQRL